MNIDFILPVLGWLVIAVTLAWYLDSVIRYLAKKAVSSLPSFKKWLRGLYV